jgi:SNF2 family DNA or RNA helicase
MTKAEWLKLPPKTFHRKYIPISEEQRKAYDELSRNYITSIDGSTLEIDNALVMLSKLYQISNGFLYITKEAEGLGDILPLLELDKPKKKASKANRETKFFPKQPKIQALNSLLDYELKCKKAIIWFNMEAEYILIKDLLERRGDSFLTIKGGESGTGNKVRQFNKTPSIRWLVCQAKSVNYGITVLGTSLEKLEASDIEALPNVSSEVSDEVFYSLNYSLEVFLQQQDRIHRIGQNNECNYWLLIANTSVEHSIKEAIENKMTIREDMLIDIARKLQNIDSKN